MQLRDMVLPSMIFASFRFCCWKQRLLCSKEKKLWMFLMKLSAAMPSRWKIFCGKPTNNIKQKRKTPVQTIFLKSPSLALVNHTMTMVWAFTAPRTPTWPKNGALASTTTATSTGYRFYFLILSSGASGESSSSKSAAFLNGSSYSLKLNWSHIWSLNSCS